MAPALGRLALLLAMAAATEVSLLQLGLQAVPGELGPAGPPAPVEAASLGHGASSTFCGYTVKEGRMPVLTSPTGQSFLVELTDAFAQSTDGTIRVMITAMVVGGTYTDSLGFANSYGTPMESTPSSLFELRLSPDKTTVDVFMPQTEVRTSDEQMEETFKRGTGTSFLGSFSNLQCMAAAAYSHAPGGGKLAADEEHGPPRIVKVSRTASLSADRDGERHQEDPLQLSAQPVAPPAAPKRIIISGKDLMNHGFLVAPSLGMYAVQTLRSADSFPGNIDVSVTYPATDSSVGFSMTILADAPMTPRVADDRLLYFTTSYTDLGQHPLGERERPASAVDRKTSVIWRYDLSAVRQIRMYVDPSVPPRWRRYFREGIEAWNAAFAAAGKPNAVRAVCPEDKDWPADYHVSDIRYSTISWSLSQQVVSMGIAKVDPRSGEILKSDIIMADGWVKHWMGDMDLLVPNVTYTLDERRGFHAETRTRGRDALGLELPFAAPERSGVELGAALGLLALGADVQTESAQENIIGQGLRQIVMHEAGHALGLRHNFKGSMGVSYACTQDINCSAVHGLTASVMDYLPMNLAAKGSGPVHAFSPVVGAYDKAAIAYGYTDADDKMAMARNTRPAELMTVVGGAEDFETCYDSDADLQDPSCHRYDATASPLRFYGDKLDRVAERQQDVLANAVLPGKSYKNFGNAVHSLLYMAGNTGLDAMAWIGGMNVSYAHRGLTGEARAAPAKRPMPVDLQRQALSLVLKVLRPADNGYVPKPEDMAYLIEGSHLDEVKSGDLSYDIRHIGSVLLQRLLDKSQLTRIYSQERYALEKSNESFSLGEFFSTVESSIFSKGLNTVSVDDWNLHTAYVDSLVQLAEVQGVPAVVTAQALIQLRRADEFVATALRNLQVNEELVTSWVNASAPPRGVEVLQAHLLNLYTKLSTALCKTSSECVAQSGALTPKPAAAALLALLGALGAQLLG